LYFNEKILTLKIDDIVGFTYDNVVCNTSKYPLFFYILYYISYFFVKYNFWKLPENKQQNNVPIADILFVMIRIKNYLLFLFNNSSILSNNCLAIINNIESFGKDNYE
jgi:hypothetical protein